MGGAPTSWLDVDITIVLSGVMWATRDRLLQALTLLHDSVDAGRLVLPSGVRSLQDGEREWLRQIGLPVCDNELEAIEQIVAHETSPLGHVRPSDPPIEIMVAASSDSTRRTNTEDQMRHLAENVQDARSALCVTNAIYIPYQGVTCARCLGFDAGWTVEMAAVPPNPDNGRSEHLYLQEIKSAIDAMTTLRDQLVKQ